MVFLLQLLLQEFFCHGFEFLVPFFAEAPRERTFQEFVSGEVELAAFLHGVAAYVTAVVVQPGKSVAELLFAYGV